MFINDTTIFPDLNVVITDCNFEVDPETHTGKCISGFTNLRKKGEDGIYRIRPLTMQMRCEHNINNEIEFMKLFIKECYNNLVHKDFSTWNLVRIDPNQEDEVINKLD